MGSIPDSFGPSRSNVRRYSTIHTRLQGWNKGRPIGDVQPYLQNQLQTHVTRTPALDLAQQAQLAACNYLGYNPRDLPNAIYRRQGLPSDASRPLELHMHHHHHHYVASPTSPFSQTSSQYGEGATDVPAIATAANELTFRVGSRIPANTTSTSSSYATIGLHGSSVGPPFVHGFQPPCCVKNSSQSILHGKSLGDIDATQRYLENVLWLKNQIDNNSNQASKYGQEQRVEKKVGSERGIMGRELGSPDSGLSQSISSERKPIRQAKKLLWSHDKDELRDSASEADACSIKSKRSMASDSAVLTDKSEQTSAFRNYQSPYNSPSEDNSVTDSSASNILVVPTKCERNPRLSINIRRTKLIRNGETNGSVEPSGLQMSKSQGMFRSAGCLTCPSWPKSRGRDPKMYGRANNLCDDTTSSLEDDSICSSGKGSNQRSSWTYNSSCTESESQRKGFSLPGRPSKKRCGPRASRRNLPREARAFESTKEKPPKSLYHSNVRLDERDEPECVYEMDSEKTAEERGREDRQSHVSEGKPSLQDRRKEDKETGDADKSSVLGCRSQNCFQNELENARNVSLTGYAEVAWLTSVGSNRGIQPVSDEQVRTSADKLKLDNLHNEEPYTLSSQRANANKARDNSSHNKLREAVEAAWQTSLGSKNGIENYDVKLLSHQDCEAVDRTPTINRTPTNLKYHLVRDESPHREPENYDVKHLSHQECEDVDRNPTNLKYHVVRDESPLRELKDGPAAQSTVEGKVHTYEEAWQASLRPKIGIEENYKKKEPTDPVFQNIHRDHENLKALVAREESLQRELKHQTVARVAAEERARVAAEQKAHLYAASAKAAEEGLRVLLDERAIFHDKFKEELEQGATDRLRLQELLQLEKIKLEATEGELKEVRRSFQDSLAVGTRALPSKNLLQDPRVDKLSVNAVAPHGIGAGHDEARWQLMAESESRIAAEAKASYFEASAKAAEERLRCLLDERNSFYSRFKEELEHNNTDMIRLQQLMELEKANDGHSNPPQQMRSLRDSSVQPRNLDNNTEDGQRALPSGVHYRGPLHSRLEEELATPDTDRHRFEPLLEFEEFKEEQVQNKGESEAMALSYGMGDTSEPETSNFKELREDIEEIWMPPSSMDVYNDRDAGATHEKSSMKNEKKRPLSPMNSSRVRHWKSPDGPFSVKIERCKGGDGETTTVFDISPGKGGFNSLDLQFGQTPESPEDCPLAADEPTDIKEDTFNVRKSSHLSENCAELSNVDSGQALSLPTKWKKETKAELRRMIQEQELTWKIAEDAVEELGRRLELLERYKMDIQETLGRSRAVGNMDCFFTRLEEKLEDVPKGFNSFYKSPIYEGQKSLCNSPTYEEQKGRPAISGTPAQQVCISSNKPSKSKDCQIQQLKVEISQLKDELQRREKKRAISPKMKSDCQSFPPSTPSPILPTPPPSVVSDWSVQLLSRFEASMTHKDPPLLNHVSEENLITLEVIAHEMEPELPDDPFEEMKTVTTEATQSGRREYSNRKVDKLEHPGDFPLRNGELDLDNRSWVPTPDDENGEKIGASIGIECPDCQPQQIDYYCNNGFCQDKDNSMLGDVNSDQGELQVLKAAVGKLSHIFWEQEGKLKTFSGAANKEEADSSQAMDLRHMYLELLKGMSQQLGELCRDLQANTHEKLVQKCQRMEMMDQPAATTQSENVMEEAQQKLMRGNAHLILTEKLASGAEQLFKVVDDQVEEITSEAANIRGALKAAEKKIEDQMSTNLLLTEKLESGAKHLSKVIEEHTKEVARKDQNIIQAQELNIHLANDMSQTEKSLAELRSRYNSLVSNLEYQLDAARKEAVKLQETVNELKVEMGRKESLVSNLQGETKEQEAQIKDLRSQMQAIQDETNETFRENLELTKCLEAERKEVDNQHRHVQELISINEDLIEFSQGKEDEITALTKTVKSLGQSVKKKSDDIEKMSTEALKFAQEVVEARKEGEAYRLRCITLKFKLEETEHELLAREDSMERLTQHLCKTIEGQDFILEEKEQLLLSLNKAQYKEHRMDDQVRQSKIIIEELEEKLNSMDADINRARLEMAHMKAKEQEALAMRNRVHQLEEEVMEKEGQISILKTTFPGEYTSTF